MYYDTLQRFLSINELFSIRYNDNWLFRNWDFLNIETNYEQVKKVGYNLNQKLSIQNNYSFINIQEIKGILL